MELGESISAFDNKKSYHFKILEKQSFQIEMVKHNILDYSKIALKQNVKKKHTTKGLS